MQSVPKNTSRAITYQKVDGEHRYYDYYPPTSGKNYASYFIPKPHRMINLLLPEKDMNRQIHNQDVAFREEMAKDEEYKNGKKDERSTMLEEKRKHEVITNFILIGYMDPTIMF